MRTILMRAIAIFSYPLWLFVVLLTFGIAIAPVAFGISTSLPKDGYFLAETPINTFSWPLLLGFILGVVCFALAIYRLICIESDSLEDVTRVVTLIAVTLWFIAVSSRSALALFFGALFAGLALLFLPIQHIERRVKASRRTN